MVVKGNGHGCYGKYQISFYIQIPLSPKRYKAGTGNGTSKVGSSFIIKYSKST